MVLKLNHSISVKQKLRYMYIRLFGGSLADVSLDDYSSTNNKTASLFAGSLTYKCQTCQNGHFCLKDWTNRSTLKGNNLLPRQSIISIKIKANMF